MQNIFLLLIEFFRNIFIILIISYYFSFFYFLYIFLFCFVALGPLGFYFVLYIFFFSTLSYCHFFITMNFSLSIILTNHSRKNIEQCCFFIIKNIINKKKSKKIKHIYIHTHTFIYFNYYEQD